jgi:hypothetical protein
MTDVQGYYQANLGLSLAKIMAIAKASDIDLLTRQRGEPHRRRSGGWHDGAGVRAGLGAEAGSAQGKRGTARHRQCDEDANRKLESIGYEATAFPTLTGEERALILDARRSMPLPRLHLSFWAKHLREICERVRWAEPVGGSNHLYGVLTFHPILSGAAEFHLYEGGM